VAAASAVLAGCPVDDRALQSPPLDWIELGSGGQVGEGEAGHPSVAGAEHGGSGGGAGEAASSGGSATASEPGPAGSGGANDPGQGCGPTCELVTNGTFDRNVASWVADAKVEQKWSKLDAAGEAASGSLVVTSSGKEDVDGFAIAGTEQCVEVKDEAEYHFVAQVRFDADPGEGSAGVALWFFGEPDCRGAILDARTQVVTSPGAWLPAATDPPTAAGARSMALRLIVMRPYRTPTFSASFDDVVLLER
jgi:hypothetical protein